MTKNTTSVVVVSILVIAAGLFLYYYSKNPDMMGGTYGSSALKGLTAGPIVGSVKSETLGEYLTDTKGATLYVFAADKKLESNCNGECAKTWMPFMYDNQDPSKFTDTLSKRMNTVKRMDGTYQYAYGEKPLYYYVGDQNPGEAKGNGMGEGKWSVVLITP